MCSNASAASAPGTIRDHQLIPVCAPRLCSQRDNRLFIEAVLYRIVLWIARTGSVRRDVQQAFCKWFIYTRFWRWTQRGV